MPQSETISLRMSRAQKEAIDLAPASAGKSRIRAENVQAVAMKNYTRIKIENPDLLIFTSDPHFFHERIIEYCSRPFRDAQEMGEAFIRNWNAVVPRNDDVFVLGDMFWKMGDMEKCVRVMDRLNGRKWLVAGNHDLFTRDDYLFMCFEDARDYLFIHYKIHKNRTLKAIAPRGKADGDDLKVIILQCGDFAWF